MGYNLVDMIWIGRLGSGAVAAVGAAGMFMWLANGVTTVSYTHLKLSILSAGEVSGIPSVAVKCVDIRRNTSGEGGLLDGNCCLLYTSRCV